MATLYDIYKSKGKSLPESPTDRFSDTDFSSAAAKAGINKDVYAGTADQNNAISRFLVPSSITTSGAPRKELTENTRLYNDALSPLATMDSKVKTETKAIDDELGGYMTRLNELEKTSSLASKNLLRGITSDYTSRKAEESDQNDRYMKGLQLLGLQGGEAQATPQLQTGMLRKAEIEGHKELARIDGEERKALAEAEQAKFDNDYKLFNEKINLYKTARAEKAKVISDLYTEASNRMKFKQDEIDLMESYGAGLYSEYSKLTGTDREEFIKEVSEQLNVSPQSVVAGLANHAESVKKKAGSGTPAYKLTSTQKNKLLGAGFTLSQINDIASDIGDGLTVDEIKEGLKNASIDQINALDDSFGSTSADDKKKIQQAQGAVQSILSLNDKKLNKLLEKLELSSGESYDPANLPTLIYEKIMTGNKAYIDAIDKATK